MRLDLFYDRRVVAAMIAVVGLFAYAALLHSCLRADGLAFPNGGLLGGDFIALWTAAREAVLGEWSKLYRPRVFEALLIEASNGARDGFGLTWQYPPHAGLLIAPFGRLPYTWAWAGWCAAGMVAFALALRRGAGVPARAVVLVLLSPVAFQAAVTGQTGLLVGAALLGALVLPDRRPILAGVLAGLVTVKPQLCLLLPFAYLAAGRWRTLAAMAVTFGSLVALSASAFGPGAWIAWAEAVAGVTEGMGKAAYPLGKMVTVFAALRSADLPEPVAFAAQAVVFAMAAALTTRLWRSGASSEAKAALTACLVFLTTPYAYYYDVPVLALPFLYVLSRLEGPSIGRRACLYLCWMAPLWIVSLGSYGAFLGLSAVLLLTILTLRAAAPQTKLTLSTA